MKFSSLNGDLTPQSRESPDGSTVLPIGLVPVPDESLFATTVQVFIVVLVAGFGNVATGLILDKVQHWTVFVNLTEMFILVPVLLGLKGNLEMTMAARLSTQANLGQMQDWKTIIKIAKGNICLIQSQATVVSFIVSVIAIVVNVIKEGREFELHNALVLASSSLMTANIACLFLGILMVFIVIFSNRYRIDPDNIATPIAASLGDVTTMILLAALSQLIYNFTNLQNHPALAGTIIVFFLLLLPLWFSLAYRNPYTTNVIMTGWSPVILAMIIASIAGFLLDYGTGRFKRLAAFQPVINGVGGNLVAVQASRISTYLHRSGKPGHMPVGHTVFSTPVKAFFDEKDNNVRTARLLLLMAFPAHILYMFVIRIMESEVRITPLFLITYILFSVLQVLVLLYLAYNLIFFLWKKGIDPDNWSIPILTATGDFLGSAFLLLAFMILSIFGDPNSVVANDRQ